MTTDESSVFETKADYRQSKLDYYEDQFDRWVAGPFKILWSDWRGRVGILVGLLYVFIGTIGIHLWPEPRSNQGPTMEPALTNPVHPLGTDRLGQDMLALMVHATPDMLKMIVAGAIFANMMGVSIGLYSGYVSGTTDKVLMTLVDTVMSIPGIPLLIVIAAILQPTNPYLIGIILAIQSWAGVARNIRAQVFPLVQKEHVEASRALGQPMSNVLLRQILPHLLPYIFIGFLGGATSIVFASVALYFLGILPFTVQNWGVVLNYAYQDASVLYSLSAAHWIVVPLVTIVGLTVALTLLAQAFDQVFNPRVRARHKSRKQAKKVIDGDGEAVDGAGKATSQDTI